jgi:hypothetical protein
VRNLTVSFGTVSQASITAVKSLTWEKFSQWLVAEPPIAADKSERGWFIPGTFEPVYRDSDNFVSRDAITLDFDKVTLDTWGDVQFALGHIAFAMYTTFTHDDLAPRFRVVIPLSRPTGYDEFQAVVRKIAEKVGIEWVARESFVPAQMTYSPTRRQDAPFRSQVNDAAWLQVDEVLNEYADWTNVKSWPRRSDGDAVHSVSEGVTPPDEKPGVVGDFCRAYRVADVIAKFNLPYTPAGTEGRWTYTDGSRPEGAIEYDDGLKFHSHHDTDPARGQHNAFDLVRCHKFGGLDAGSGELAITDRPSYRAMADLVRSLAEVAGTAAADQYPDLGPLPEVTEEVKVNDDGTAVARFIVQTADTFSSGPAPTWIIRDVLPRAELAVIYGESGSGKSFLTLDLCTAITRGLSWRGKRTERGRVVYVCAEGAGGFKSRLRAYARGHDADLHELPAVIADAPNLLESSDAVAIIQSIKQYGAVDVVVIDTLSATTPGGNENSGEDIGLVISHCKLLHRHTGALVVLIHHSGKDATKGARGWSGLRAAADAEIEVTRNGDFRMATITKAKDSIDGGSYSFKLKPVILGLDAHGEEESSCIVEHTDEQPEAAKGAKQRASGKHQIPLYEVLKTMAPSGTVNYEDLVAGFVKKMPRGEAARDTRKRDAKRALEELIAKKLAYMHDDDRVSLTTNIQMDSGDWV